MASSDDQLPPKDPLEDEKAKVMYSVTRMRKLFPKKCSQFLSKKLKVEHSILETTEIVLENSEDVPEDLEESEDPETEMDSDEPVDKLTLLNGFAEVGKEMDNILAVLEQMKAEKDCDIIKTCTQGMSSSESYNEKRTSTQ